MEDFFQIIIILVFIISSIVSSMRKKKKQQAKKTFPVKVESKTNSQQQKSSADILEELLGFKVNLPEPQKQEAPPVYAESSQADVDTWDPEKEFSDKNADGYNDYQEKINAKKVEFDLDRNKYKAFKEDITLPIMIKKPVHKKNLFTKQTNLKDYIIIQEILNKPKAFRR